MCIKLHFYLFIVSIYFYAIHKLNIFLIFYGFAILHEIAHIIIAFFLNVKIKEICFLPVGVCAKYDYIDAKWKEIVIAASGPLFSIFLVFSLKDLLVREANFAIAILNLIPIYPLDGGRIIRGIIEIFMGYKKSIIISNCISKVVLLGVSFLGIILAVYFKNYSLIFLDIYIFSLIKEELKKERIIKIVNTLIGDK